MEEGKLGRRKLKKGLREVLKESNDPKIQENASRYVREWWDHIILPEVKGQANTKIVNSTGGYKKRSAAQILEKSENPKSVESGKRMYNRDSRGRFVRHDFHSAMSMLGDSKQELFKGVEKEKEEK